MQADHLAGIHPTLADSKRAAVILRADIHPQAAINKPAAHTYIVMACLAAHITTPPPTTAQHHSTHAAVKFFKVNL